jgi:general L-amino acid transport system substrate-binding protein
MSSITMNTPITSKPARGLIKGLALVLGLAAIATAPAYAQTAPQGPTTQRAPNTLEAVRARGHLLCGVNGDLAGFSAPDPAGRMRGLEADFCRAIAAAIFGDPEKLRFVNKDTIEAGLDALAARRIDVLARGASATFSRDAGRPVTPTAVLFYDGMGFLVPRGLNVTSPRQMRGKTICWAGSPGAGTAGDNLIGFSGRHGLNLTIRRFDQPAEAVAATQAGSCDAFAGGTGALASRRVTDFDVPEQWLVLPEVISLEPLTPYVRADDENWRGLVFWVTHVLIAAEYLGVTSVNVTENLGNPDARVRQMLGVEPGFGRPLGLPDNWAARLITAVGNYGELFDRSLGHQSILAMDRGLNDQWTRGGLLYSFPTR